MPWGVAGLIGLSGVGVRPAPGGAGLVAGVGLDRGGIFQWSELGLSFVSKC